MNPVVIVSAARTPIGRLGGALSSMPAHQLGAIAIRDALRRAQVDASEVSEVVLGQVLTACTGQNPSRQAAVAAGIPHRATAYGINQVCGSGLRAVVLGWQNLQRGDAEIVVAGGQESMSRAPHGLAVRAGVKLGDAALIDTLMCDGLIDAFHNYPMGRTAENLAEKFSISRTVQDEFAAASQRKAAAAEATGFFSAEIAPVRVPTPKGETVIDRDETIRPDSTVKALAALRPVFSKTGTVTAGNASSINDGAAAVVLMTAAAASTRRLQPMARIVSWATCGVDPEVMGIGPVPAVRLALERAGWKLDSVDLIEANEAFAVQCCAVGRELGWDPNRVNVNGGAIALGHPIGASGARLLVTLLHEMIRRKVRRGLVTLCIGGGMGIALCVERD